MSVMEANSTLQHNLGLVELPSAKLGGDANGRETSPPAQDAYEVRPRKDRDGFDLISDRLRYGPIWYAGPDAVRNAVAYAKYHSWSRSRRAIIRVFDESGKAIQTYEHKGDFKEW
jgi:hypothetical protein